MTSATRTQLRDTHRYFNQQIFSVKFVQERNSFPVFSSKESVLLQVQHSAAKYNLLAFKTCCDWSLMLPVKLRYMSNKKKVCTTAKHNNILTAHCKEVALLCQTSVPNCGIPTSSNNLPRLSYLMRMM